MANAFLSGGIFLSGSNVNHFNAHTITPDNLVNGRPLRYYANCAGIDVDGIPVGQLIVANCTGVRVANVTISDTDVGIQMAFVRDVQIMESSISLASRHATLFEESSDFTLSASRIGGSVEGIAVQSSSAAVIVANEVSGNGQGITVRNSDGVSLVGNVLSNNTGSGILVSSSTRVALRGNQITGKGNSVQMESSTSATITGNAFSGTGIRFSDDIIFEQGLRHFNSHTITPDNLVNGRPLRYYANCAGIDVDGIPVGQLIVANCTGVRVANVTISDTNVGIQMAFVDGVRVADSAVSGNRLGIRFYKSDEIAVANTDASWNAVQSVFLGFVTNATVSNVTVSNGMWGMTVLVAGNVTIENSTVIANNRSGIGMAVVDDIVLRANTVSGNSRGIDLITGTNGTVVGNSVSFNEYGIFLGGFSGARVHHNTLVGNRVQAFDDRGDDNAWDAGFPRGGNFWSDYTGIDRCSGPAQDICPSPDRIGDTPYVIDVDSMDHYPILVPADTPPSATFTVAPEQGDVTTSFTVDAGGSADPLDPPERLQVRWDWEGDGAWDTPWTTGKRAQHRYETPGVYTIRLEVRNTRDVSAFATRQVFVSPDTTPPLIVHLPERQALVGRPLAVRATVTDAGGVQVVLLYYRFPGDAEFIPVVMSSEGDDGYAFELPPSKTIGTLSYYILALDRAGNLARSPESGGHAVAVLGGGEGLSAVVVGLAIAAAMTIALVAYTLYRKRKRKQET